MTLLRDIQNEAASQNSRVSDLLRRCKILAARLQSEELNLWVERELNGYKDQDDLPDYRIIRYFQIKGHFSGPFGTSIENGAISLLHLPKALREPYSEIRVPNGVSFYEDLLAGNSTSRITNPIPTEHVMLFSQKVYQGYACMQAWREVPRGAFVSVLDTVRNKILGFVLDIEKENPNAGEADVNTTPVPEPVVSQVFHSNFYGNVGNVATGSQDFEQNATVNQQRLQTSLNLDLTKLAVELPQLREALPRQANEPDQYLAIGAVRSAELEVQKKNAPKVLENLAKAGKWSLDVAKEIGSTVAAEAIKKAMGLGNP